MKATIVAVALACAACAPVQRAGEVRELRASTQPAVLFADSDDTAKLDAVWQGAPAASFVQWDEPEVHDRQIRFSSALQPSARFASEAAARAAFAAITLMPGMPITGQLDVQNAQPFYRRVIELATSHPAFTRGELHPLVTDAPMDVIAYGRGDVVVLVNTRPRDVDVTVHGRTLHHARDLVYGWVQSGDRVKLSAYGTAILDPRRR